MLSLSQSCYMCVERNAIAVTCICFVKEAAKEPLKQAQKSNNNKLFKCFQ